MLAAHRRNDACYCYLCRLECIVVGCVATICGHLARREYWNVVVEQCHQEAELKRFGGKWKIGLRAPSEERIAAEIELTSKNVWRLPSSAKEQLAKATGTGPITFLVEASKEDLSTMSLCSLEPFFNASPRPIVTGFTLDKHRVAVALR